MYPVETAVWIKNPCHHEKNTINFTDKNLENGLKTEDINTPMQNSGISRTPQLSEFEKVQLQQQEVQDIARANLQRVHIFLAKYDEFADQLAEIEKRTFKDEIVKSFNKPDQKQFWNKWKLHKS